MAAPPPRHPLPVVMSFALLLGLLTIGGTAEDAAGQAIPPAPVVTGGGVHSRPSQGDPGGSGSHPGDIGIAAIAPSLSAGSLSDLTAEAVGTRVESVSYESYEDVRYEPFEAGSRIGVYIEFNASVKVTGSPTLTLIIGAETREAQYARTVNVTSTLRQAALLFRYRVQATDHDPDGLSIGSHALRLNGGAIDGGDGPADLTLPSPVVNNPLLKVDGRVNNPATVRAIYFSSRPQRGDTFSLGNSIEVAVWFSKDVITERTTSDPLPVLELQIGSHTRRAGKYAFQPDTMYFGHRVQEEDLDENGISIPANALSANGVRIRDHAGNDADLRHPAVADDPDYKVDGRVHHRLQVTDVAFHSVPLCCETYPPGESIIVVVSFDQALSHIDGGSQWPYMELMVGSEARQAGYVTSPPVVATGAGYGYLFAYEVRPSDHDADGVSVETNALRFTATDSAGSPADTNLGRHAIRNDAAHKVDGAYLGPRGALPPVELTARGPPATVDVSGAFRGEVSSYTATSSNPAVAAVTASGDTLTITPLTPGTTTIEVTARGRVDPSRVARQLFVVTVITHLEPTGTLPPLNLMAGGPVATVDLSAAFRGGATAYTATSSDPLVATVTVVGATLTVSPLRVGTATIEVTARNALGTANQAFGVTVLQPFTDDPIVPGETPIKAVHFAELRSNIDALRAAAGLGRFAWTDPLLRAGVTRVRRRHLLELRSALAGAYSAAGRPAPSWTDPMVAERTPIRATHLTELRDAVMALR